MQLALEDVIYVTATYPTPDQPLALVESGVRLYYYLHNATLSECAQMKRLIVLTWKTWGRTVPADAPAAAQDYNLAGLKRGKLQAHLLVNSAAEYLALLQRWRMPTSVLSAAHLAGFNPIYVKHDHVYLWGDTLWLDGEIGWRVFNTVRLSATLRVLRQYHVLV